jgi:uncharacterized metal-binding protein
MSNYKTHTALNLLLFLPLSLFLLYLCFSPTRLHYLLFAGSFAYGTLFMSPDLDLANRIKLFSVRGLLTLPFRSYALVFKHRGISHSLIFGTLTRVGWLFLHLLIILFLFFEFSSPIDSFFAYLKGYKGDIAYALAGLFIADSAHVLLDKIS